MDHVKSAKFVLKKKNQWPMPLRLSSDMLLVWENILHFLPLLCCPAHPPPTPSSGETAAGFKRCTLVKDSQDMHLNQSRFFGGWGGGG